MSLNEIPLKHSNDCSGYFIFETHLTTNSTLSEKRVGSFSGAGESAVAQRRSIITASDGVGEGPAAGAARAPPVMVCGQNNGG